MENSKEKIIRTKLSSSPDKSKPKDKAPWKAQRKKDQRQQQKSKEY